MGRLVYALIFCVLIPLLIVWGSYCLEPYIGFAVPDCPIAGWVAAAIGFAVMLAAMAGLKLQGGGLPMNGYPPPKFVASGVYAVCPHPIYVASVLVCGGISVGCGSRAGLYVFTPLLALGCVAIVWGYERIDLIRRFGSSAPPTWFGIPAANDDFMEIWRRFGAGVVPLLVSGIAVYILKQFHGHWPEVWPQGIWLVYLLAVSCQRTGRRMLHFINRWLILSLAGILLCLPVNVLYGCWLLLCLVGFSSRAVEVDTWILRQLFRVTGTVSNSWKSWRFGPLRIMNHAVYTFLAAAVGFYLTLALTGGAGLKPFLLVTGCSLLGAGLWAQLVEGSSKLLRPFGFYGAVFGAALGFMICGMFDWGVSLWVLMGAAAVAAPFIQAIGRLRCMVQGCCHGRPVRGAAYGVSHTNPSSRVCLMSEYTGTVLHATALYSLLINLLIGWLLLVLWQNHCAAGLIAGLYLALSGLGRFIEEAYRGEPQTRHCWRLSQYQWLAVLLVLGAFAIWSVPASMIKAPAVVWCYPFCWIAVIVGLVYAFAMSMDFPESNRRFSRLSG